ISNNNAFLQGLYLALCGVAMLLFTPVGGVLGDRINKAKIMYVCDYIKGSEIILATVLMLLFREPPVHIAILFVLGITGNCVSGVFNPAAGALFPHILDAEQLQQANSYFSMKSSLEGILGVILAGVLYALLPIHVLFFIVGLCFLASAISEGFIRYEHLASTERLTLKAALRDMGEGFDYLKAQKAIVALIGAILFINFFLAPVTGNFLPFFVKTELAAAPSYLFDSVLKPELWSSVFSVFLAVSSLIGAFILSSKAPTEKCGHRVAVLLCFYSVLMIGLTAGYYVFIDRGLSVNAFLITMCVGSFIMGILLSNINIPISTAMMRVVDRDKLSKVNSLLSIGSQGMIPIASVLAGAILELFGSTALLVFCALGFTATAVLTLFNRRLREI
ncbi:MAG: MFS transporter, partial [Lachnospiraceae bacterium]|nr:MFS transporter [Lachnospiraceae bacterium]